MPLTLKPGAPCPCQSGRRYRECCEPVHKDARAAATAEAMMRSRYTAFAIGHIDHLMATFHPTHPDMAIEVAKLRASILASARDHRYLGLTIVDTSEDGDRATVTFRARVFSKGKDLSFEERSVFLRKDRVWLYAAIEEADS